jgi:hypothetical protein
MRPPYPQAATGGHVFAMCDGVFCYIIKCPVQETGKWQEHGKAPDSIFFTTPPWGGKKGSSPAGRRIRHDISAVPTWRQSSQVYFRAVDRARFGNKLPKIKSGNRRSGYWTLVGPTQDVNHCHACAAANGSRREPDDPSNPYSPKLKVVRRKTTQCPLCGHAIGRK